MDYLKNVLAGGPMVMVLAAVAIALCLDYLWRYVVRGLRLRSQLRRLAENIKGFGGQPRSSLRQALAKVFADTACAHAWSEYEETLHDQCDVHGGERRVREIRATVPSENFINLDAIVDPRIGSEYFKHLPGILTGLGIIGTFKGLIDGLMAFNPNVEAEALKISLNGLFGHVMHAFTFSMIAIAAAMVMTMAEKWIYAACAKWVGAVSQSLDGLFRAGVGEEYLSGLLQSSQDNATQTRQLKESLVQDLKELLTQLTERQVAATQQLSVEIGRQIEGSLREPLDRIADTVRQASGQQTQAAGAALETLMRAFIDKMQETLGGQMAGLSDMMRASAQSMTQVETAMQSLVGDMQRVSGESTDGMRRAVQELVENMVLHQREQTTQSQASVGDLLARVESSVGSMAQQQQAMSERSEHALSGLMEAMHARVDQLAGMNRESQEQSSMLARSVGEVSTKAIAGLESGAAAVGHALAGVQQATERLDALVEQMAMQHAALGQSAQQISQSSSTLAGATQSLNAATGSLGATSLRFENVGTLMQSEGEVRSEMLRHLEQLAQQTKATGQSLASLTDEVREKLTDSLEQFGGGVSRVVESNLVAYNKQLGAAVSMLASALEEISQSADARA